MTKIDVTELLNTLDIPEHIKLRLLIQFSNMEVYIDTLETENRALKSHIHGLEDEVNDLSKGGYLWK